ncbi:MAG: 23S rRNA (uracil(1939)-C(5))-methyltransferase RlmD [Lautropia sp.]
MGHDGVNPHIVYRGTLALDIESLDLEGQGIAHHDGKVVFVRGALPGERVLAGVVRSKPRHDVAQTLQVLKASALRVTPRCPHYGVCGGCSMQHVDPLAQVSFKQRALEETLWHLGRVRAPQILTPLVGAAWGYRFRARLTVRHVPKKGGVLVGFHEKGSSYVADMRECHTLPAHVSAMLLPLRALVAGLSIRDRMPQIEVAIGEAEAGERVTALVFRVLDAPGAADREALAEFARAHEVELWLQPGGPDTIALLWPARGSTLRYTLPEFGVVVPFAPTDFTQVNAGINRSLVERAVRLLDVGPADTVLDLFCGLGNFTLALATRARRVIGIEGARGLIERARANAQVNRAAREARGLPFGELSFQVANLFDFDAAAWAALGDVDRLLIDPPRDGALAVAKVLASAAHRPRRIVYVSCNPATLARDLGILVHEGGWELAGAGVVNMFPQTSHVESIAVLDRADGA